MENTCRKKLFRVTTADISLDGLLKGQLKYLNQYFDVVGVAKDTGVLEEVGKREGIRVIDAPLVRPISLIKDIRALWFLYRLFRKEKPWCVHANTPKGSLLSMIAAYFARVPHRIYTVTGLRYQGVSGLLRSVLKMMERVTCLCATNVIPEGYGVLHCLQADGITHKPLRVIYNGNINGVDTEFFKKEESIPHESYTFIFVGRIVRDKGIAELVSAMKQLPEARLLLVGSFEKGDPIAVSDKNYLMNSSQVIFVGWQSDVRPYMLQADCLVFPSYREGFPNVPLQAGCMELPSIVTNINGCNEIIKDGLNGKIIRPHDADALYMTMKWMLEHNEEGLRMGCNAREIVQAKYEQKDVWKGLIKMYQELK